MRVAPKYEDFVLRIEALPGQSGLWIRVVASPAGTSRVGRFEAPFGEQESLRVLRSLEGTIWRSGQGESEASRHVRVESPDEVRAELDPSSIGGALFEALFTGQIREKLVVSLGKLDSREGTGLRIRLLIDSTVADAVGRWPWELLYREETRDFLGRNLMTPIVRQIEIERPPWTPEPLTELCVLAVLSDPEGVERLDVAREKDLLESALGSAAGVRLQFLEHPTIEELRAKVRDEPFNVLHFVGHGDLDGSGDGRVLFEEAHGGAEPVTGLVLADTLNSCRAVRMVFLNACETARLPRAADGHDPFLGTAAALIMAGIPAVVANQFPISDQAALNFSSTFYRNLAAGDSLESAVAEGRKAIFRWRPGSWEWATPVLFLGIPHGEIFTVGPACASEPPSLTTADPPPSVADPVTPALDLYERRFYDRAEEAFLKAKEVEPDRPVTVYYLALSRLRGRRPRSSRLDIIRKIEAALNEAGYLLQQQDQVEPAHFWYLRALLKHDFYRFKGMRILPPTIEESLIEANSVEADPVELERILNHVPTPPSPVREAIEARLRGLAAQ